MIMPSMCPPTRSIAGRGGALVRHVLHVHLRNRLEELDSEMRQAAVAGGTEVELARLRLG
jgi:hypothetical protein